LGGAVQAEQIVESYKNEILAAFGNIDKLPPNDREEIERCAKRYVELAFRARLGEDVTRPLGLLKASINNWESYLEGRYADTFWSAAGRVGSLISSFAASFAIAAVKAL
jgi:hypothetical protein